MFAYRNELETCIVIENLNVTPGGASIYSSLIVVGALSLSWPALYGSENILPTVVMVHYTSPDFAVYSDDTGNICHVHNDWWSAGCCQGIHCIITLQHYTISNDPTANYDYIHGQCKCYYFLTKVYASF